MAVKVGLTGGIGSGKSTVASEFSRLGITVIDADQIARTLTLPDTPCFAEIVQRFGNVVLSEAGELDRKKLGEIVFNSPTDRNWLELLLHPRIRTTMDSNAESDQGVYCILEIPLLVESKRDVQMEQVVVVHCPRNIRKQRLLESRDIDAAKIDKIMEAQATDQQRLDAADHVIDNSGSMSQLLEQIQTLHHTLLKKFTREPNNRGEL